MKSARKTVLKGFDYLHCDDFARYLEEMAAKGWHFKEWGAGLVFEQGEPRKETYAVEVFSEASEYDTRPEPRTEEFAEYCEAAGWVLVDAKRKFCIFRKVRPDAVEILTQEERLQNIAKEERKAIWQKLGLTFWFAALRILNYTTYSSFVNNIFSNDAMLADAMWFVLFLAALVRCIHFYIWKYRSERHIRQGGRLHFGKQKNRFSFLNGWYGWISGSFITAFFIILLLRGDYTTLLYMGSAIGALVLMAYLIAKFRPDAVTNQIIQTLVPILVFLLVLVFSLSITFGSQQEEATIPDTIPLRFEDIGGEAGMLTDANLDCSESIFGSALRCQLDYEEEYVYYYVYLSEHRWVLDKIWNAEMQRKYNQNGSDCTELWKADAAIRNAAGDYLIRYPDAVILFSADEDMILTQNQTDIIRAVLYESR